MGTPLAGRDRRRRATDRRSPLADRRHEFRGGRRASDLVLAAALSAGLATPAMGASLPRSGTVAIKVGSRATDLVGVANAGGGGNRGRSVVGAQEPMRFGVDMRSVGQAVAQGLPMTYGAFWVGAWTQKGGWGEVDRQLAEARTRGVVPVVNWWYWGDDINPQAVRDGVEDRYHHLRKDREGWSRMSRELASRIGRTMGGREAIVVLETEFNKNGIEDDPSFDALLAEQIGIFHGQHGIKVVLGFGNWGRAAWSRFPQAIAASDLLGIQLLQSSVRDAATYAQAPETLVSAARFIQTTFHKPSMVVDLALSSYGTRYEETQAQAVSALFARLPELKTAGVEGLVWRAVADDSRFDVANYHGEAERHWGLMRADGSPKPAFAAFRTGVQREAGRGTMALLASMDAQNRL